jgi:hypothetical protein
MLSECKEGFEDVEMPHKIDEFLQAARLPTDIDATLDSTGDSETAPTPQPDRPPHFSYESTNFNYILESISILFLLFNILIISL